MAGRISEATQRAMTRVGRGEKPTAAAKVEGIDASTLFRALKRTGRGAQAATAGRFVIVGAGALGREVAQWIRLDNRSEPIVFLDDFNTGADIIGTVESYERQPGDAVLIAVGDPAGRKTIGDRIAAATYVSSTATRGQCTLGEGTLLLPRCLVSAEAALGECCIVNTFASIGHDVELGAYCTLSSHVDLCGRVKVGARVFFGSGARVVPGVRIGDDSYVGAGTVVLKDLPAGSRVFGNPARAIA